MQYPYRLLHSIELSRFSNLLMPNSELSMYLIELSFRLHPKACGSWPIRTKACSKQTVARCNSFTLVPNYV